MNSKIFVGFLLSLLTLSTQSIAADNTPSEQAFELGLTISGVVSKVFVKPGQQVKKGDLLLILEDSALKAGVSAAKAQSRLTRLLLEEAQREDERAIELFERTVLSEHDRVKASISLRRAQAEHQQAQATLAESQLNLKYSRLTAPRDGRIDKLLAFEGQAVVNNQNSQTLMLLVPR